MTSIKTIVLQSLLLIINFNLPSSVNSQAILEQNGRQKRGLFGDFFDTKTTKTSIDDGNEDYYNYEYETDDSNKSTTGIVIESTDDKETTEESKFIHVEPDYYDYAYFGADYDYLDPTNNGDIKEWEKNTEKACAYAKEFPEKAKKDPNCKKYVEELEKQGYFGIKVIGNDSTNSWAERPDTLPDPKNDKREAGYCIMRGQCAKKRT